MPVVHMPAGTSAGGQFAPSGGGGAAAQPTPGDKNPVAQGEAGKRVADLQKRLNALGIKPPLKVDGKFGPKTKAAVLKFQKVHGLKPDALVGPKTTAMLRQKNPSHAAAKHKTAKGKKGHAAVMASQIAAKYGFSLGQPGTK